MSRIPVGATQEVSQAFLEVWETLDRLTRGDVDWHGRRIVNASKSQRRNDYVIRAELEDLDLSGASATNFEAEAGSGLLARLDGSGAFSGSRAITGLWNFAPSVGSVPFTTSEVGVVTNLNADMLDGLHSSSFLTGTAESGSGNFLRADGTTALSGARTVSAVMTFTANPVISNTDPTLKIINTVVSAIDWEIRTSSTDLRIALEGGGDVFMQFEEDNGIVASIKPFRADSRFMVGADPGSGIASLRTITPVTDTPTSAYAWGSGNPPDGYWKEYNGTQAVVTPFWNT